MEKSMDESYADRDLYDVKVYDVTPQPSEDGLWIETTVAVGLTGPDGDGPGPTLSLGFAFPVAGSATIFDIRRKALARTHSLLQRFAQLRLEEMDAALNSPSQFDFRKG